MLFCIMTEFLNKFAIGLGAHKSGSTWLSMMLDQHPQINQGLFKETHYFCFKYGNETLRKTAIYHNRVYLEGLIKDEINEANKNNQKLNFPRLNTLTQLKFWETTDFESSPDWHNLFYSFHHNFGSKETVYIDNTPNYLLLDDICIKKIKEYFGDIPIFIIVRDPRQRFLSQIKFHLEMRSIDIQTLKNDEIDNWFYQLIKEDVDYKNSIPKWEAHFSKIKVFPYKLIQLNPKELLLELCQFLQIGHFDFNGIDKKFNTTKEKKISNHLTTLIDKNFDEQYNFLSSKYGNKFLEMI